MGKFFTNYFTFTPCTGFHLGHQGTDIPRSRNARHPILHGTFPIPILHHPTGYQLATRDAMWCIETVVWIGNCWRYIINVRWWSLYSVWYVTFPISISNSLPETICDALRQWFELVTAGDIHKCQMMKCLFSLICNISHFHCQLATRDVMWYTEAVVWIVYCWWYIMINRLKTV